MSGPPKSTITTGITIQRKISNYCAKQETALLNAERDHKNEKRALNRDFYFPNQTKVTKNIGFFLASFILSFCFGLF